MKCDRKSTNISEMTKVPEALRYIFDRLPLKTYPAIVQDNAFQVNEFHFCLNRLYPLSDSDQKFCLAVHNVQLVKVNGEGKYVPTDPFSLADSLILCFRHNLLLPSEGGQRLSRHSMKLMSYFMSRNNELPVLIETRGSRTESITSSRSFSEAVSVDYFTDDLQGYLFNQFFDNLGDLWILILLSDMQKSGANESSRLFFQDPEVCVNNIASNVATLKLIGDVSNWASFKVRYPHTIRSNVSKLKASVRSHEILSEVITSLDFKAIEGLYIEKLQEFERAIPLVTNYLKSTAECDSRTIIELKFASFVFVTSTFINESGHIGRLLKFRLQEAVSFSKEILDRY